MFIPPSCVDGLYDYLPLFKRESLCSLPKEEIGTEVAIIGAGAAGILAAYELLKMGLKPVIYEATDRMGGRLYTAKFKQVQEEHPPFCELGAMRIPRSSRIFFHYAKKLGLHFDVKFPSAGSMQSAIYYKNHLYEFNEHVSLPHQFTQIKLLWELFAMQLVLPIHEAWEKGDLHKVRLLWQMYIEQYKDKSFYEVLRERSPIKKTGQINLFGAMGIGSGGFNSVFQVGFLEILRILINGYIDNLSLISDGIFEFVNGLYQDKVKTPQGKKSLSELNCLNLNSPVVQFDYNKKTHNPIITIKRDNELTQKEYRAVIFTGSMSAAHLTNLTNATKSGVYLLSEKVRNALRYSPMIASSKTYICTNTKFWLNTKLPRVILTDDLSKAMYLFDYPHTKHGVICMSYTWGVDAMKLHAVDPMDRVVIFKRVISAISSELNKHIQPLNNEVINIDWINQKYQNGAFKLITPGYDAKQKVLYFQFQSALSLDDRGLYLAGDSVSWSGGWVEGALYTAINSVFAVARRLGGQIPTGSPLEQPQDLYHY